MEKSYTSRINYSQLRSDHSEYGFNKLGGEMNPDFLINLIQNLSVNQTFSIRVRLTISNLH